MGYEMSEQRSIEDLYSPVLTRHRNTPSNFFVLAEANVVVHETNPLCGDDITLYIREVEDNIVSASFQGYLCAVGTASASIMSEVVAATSTTHATELAQQFRRMMNGDAVEMASDLDALRSVCRYRIRVRCALLPWLALEKALRAAS